MKKLLLITGIILLFTSCAVTKYVEVPVEVVKTEYKHDIQRDSIFIRDSVDRLIKGDTVFIYKERFIYEGSTIRDTTRIVDSIPVVIKEEIVKEVNKLRWYQQTLMWIGGVASLVVLIYILIKLKIKW